MRLRKKQKADELPGLEQAQEAEKLPENLQIVLELVTGQVLTYVLNESSAFENVSEDERGYIVSEFMSQFQQCLSPAASTEFDKILKKFALVLDTYTAEAEVKGACIH